MTTEDPQTRFETQNLEMSIPWAPIPDFPPKGVIISNPAVLSEGYGDTLISRCEAITCDANQRVSNHACTACAAGTTNAAGDDPWRTRADTEF